MNFEETLNNLFEKIYGWVEGLVLLLPNLLVAILVLLLFWVAARVARKLVYKGMENVSSYHQLNRLLATVAYVAILATATFIALGILELDKAVTSLLAGAGIIGLALAFAFQDIAGNFMSGILLAIRRPFTENDIVETNGYFGRIEELNLRSTRLRTFQGQLVIIPNSQVFQSPLVNFSQSGKRRIDLACGVAYGDDLEKAEQVALSAVQSMKYIDSERPVDLYYDAFGDSSINFVLRFWVDFSAQTDFLRARSDAIKAVKKAFDTEGITIPFPIRTLDFGVVGGVNLNEVLPKQSFDADEK